MSTKNAAIDGSPRFLTHVVDAVPIEFIKYAANIEYFDGTNGIRCDIILLDCGIRVLCSVTSACRRYIGI